MSDHATHPMLGPEPPLHAGWSTCPLCGKTWWVTPSRDCLVPVCGHYGTGTDASRTDRPCDACGLAHALKCVRRPETNQPATPDELALIETVRTEAGQ